MTGVQTCALPILNDEAIAMMQYNKSYGAACRYLTQLDEMIDKLINGTAL